MTPVESLLARANACREWRRDLLSIRDSVRLRRQSYRSERRLLTLAMRALDQRAYVVAKCEQVMA